MAATTPIFYPTKTVSSSKAAEIYREDSGKIYYVCFHCGFDSDNITDILVHIDIHFTTQNEVQSDDLVDVKCELIDQDSHDVVDPAQLEQIFIDCGTIPICTNERRFKMDTFSDVFLPEQHKLPVTEENFKNMEGIFEWKCLHCQSLFKKCTNLKQHLIKHKSNDPVLRVIKRASNNEKAVTTKAHYSFKCTLCSSEFYDSLSSEQHLKDFHAAPAPIKCITCCETFCSTEMLTEHMSTIHSNSTTTEEVLPTETKKRNEIPAEAKTKQCLCILCNKTFIGTLEFMQHTFGHFNLKPFSCPECPSKFQLIKTFNGHMKAKHHLRTEYNFLCRFCNDNVDYNNLFEFVTHAFTHHLDDRDRNNSNLPNLDATFYYHCRFCFEKFDKCSDASAHLKKNHAEDELPKGPPSAAMISGRILTERAKSGSHRSEFLHNCRNCLNTLCGSYEARKHSITEHGKFEHVTEKRWVTELYSKPVTYRILPPKDSPDKGIFKCSDCGSSFDTKIHLMRHRLMHFNVKPYQCTICSQSFSSSSQITRHMAKEHDMNEHRQMICRFCSAEFAEDNEFITHNFDHHLYESFNIGENLDTMCKYECLYCSDVILERDLLDQHLQAHEGEVLPETNGVQDTDSDESAVNKLRHNVEFMYVCLHCPKKFRLPFVARTHSKFTHKVESHEQPIKDTHCDLCDITFLAWRSLINHRAQLHPELITNRRKPQSHHKKNVCQTTKKKTRRTPEGNNCNVCNITFLNNRSMINHRTKRHPETVVMPKNRPIYNCKFCGNTFRERSNFNSHMETHVKRHSFTCDICNKTYRLKNSLQTHMLIHTKEKNFVCEECGKNFYTTSKLNLHKQVHENLTLQCEKCDKVFYTRNNFSKHQKTHIDNVRKKCELCDNTFKSSVSLRVHMFLHDSTKKYACRYCEQTFAQSSGRRGHEKSRHGFV